MYVVIIVIMLFVNFNKSSSLYFPSKQVFHFLMFIINSALVYQTEIDSLPRFSGIPDSLRCHQSREGGSKGEYFAKNSEE